MRLEIICRVLLWVLALFLAGNGLAMLLGPESWYHRVSTVPHAGPFNAHFVRDVGCAYLASAGGVLLFALFPQRGRGAAAIGVLFLALHGLVHVWDTVAGRAPLDHLLTDAVGVLLIPALIGWLIWPKAREQAL